MRLILGGYAQGRTAYAMEQYHLTEADIWDAGVQPWETYDGQRLVLHTEALVTQWQAQGKDPVEMAKAMIPRWENAVLIGQEVGCGLVPVTAQQRAWREAVGRMHTVLAAHAESVERVCCGLGMVLKGGKEGECVCGSC